MQKDKITSCRTCLSDQELSDLFSNYNTHQLSLITGLKIAPDDGLPDKICYDCVHLVEAAIKLREQSVNAEKILLIDLKIESLRKSLAEDSDNDSVDFDDLDLEFTNHLLSEEADKEAKNTKLIKNNSSKKVIMLKSKYKIDKEKNKGYVPRTDNPFDDNTGIATDVLKKKQNFESSVSALSKERAIESQVVNNKSSFEVDKKLSQAILNCSKDLEEMLLSDGEENVNVVEATDLKDDTVTSEMKTIYNILDAELENSKNRENSENLHNLADLLRNQKLSNDEDDLYELCKKVENQKVLISNVEPKPHDKKKLEKLWSIAVKPINKKGLVKCSLCSKGFQFKYFLRHATTHSDAEFTCEMCGKRFPAASALRYHQQRRHGAVKQHACADCEYRAVHRDELVNHINRVHTGARPYICDVCADSFCQRRTLVQHMRKHYGVKSLQCDFCAKLFASRSQLSSHRNRFHLLRYSYLCYLCPYQSTCRTTVRNHLTKVHDIPRDQQTQIKFVKEKR